jgi:G3E family GTPase
MCFVLAQITGFLGAGKTTLVNHILSGDHGLKIAVIENEVRQQTHAAAKATCAHKFAGARACAVRGREHR